MSEDRGLVVIVDDDASVRRALSRLLRGAGHGVECFASADEFFAAGPWHGPVCAILDLAMPGANGLEIQARIVEEELEHFEMVLCLLDRRNIKYRRLAVGPYGRRLNSLIRSSEPDRAVDRLLVASLIEARSCERFSLLSNHVRDRDAELADFYAGLFESEARHHTTYVQLAEHFAPRETVRRRLDQLSAQETEIITEGSELPRMHS